MVIGTYLEEYVFKPRRRRMKAEAWEEGFVEGLAAGRAERRKAILARVRAWSRRRRDARAKGEPFTEPLPLSEKEKIFLDRTDAKGRILCPRCRP